MPIITLEVLSDSSNPEFTTLPTETSDEATNQDPSTGVHFLTENPEAEAESDNNEAPRAKTDLLEYLMRNDGSVVCKLCGEILQSRTHWYRHKYKRHVMHPLNPSPLFQCGQCLVYFKSRKGYIGHIASRHSEVASEASPVVTSSPTEAPSKEKPVENIKVKTEPDPELSIPKSSVLNYQVTNKQAARTSETKKAVKTNKEPTETTEDCQEQRSKEEKLVTDIINRVRRECEAQGSGGAARKGYTRRTTVMHT